MSTTVRLLVHTGIVQKEGVNYEVLPGGVFCGNDRFPLFYFDKETAALIKKGCAVDFQNGVVELTPQPLERAFQCQNYLRPQK